MHARATVSLVAALAIAAGGCVTVSQPAQAQPPPPPELTTGIYGDFYDALSPYGQWVYVSSQGWAWHPYGVAGDWRPYTMGHWVYADDYGWTWVSDYSWGWAPFHYGRWVFDPRYGWVWIPGRVWGPAWVAWRWGPGWVGWAPLPPQAIWQPGVGVVYTGGDVSVLIHTGWWCFVPERRFLAPRVHRYLAHPNRNALLVRRSRHRHAWTVRQGRPVNEGIPVRQVERVVGHPVRPVRVLEAPQAPRRGRPARVQGGTLRVYRPPRLQARPAPARPAARPAPERRPATPARPAARPAPQRRPATPARPAARPAPAKAKEKAKPAKGKPAKKDDGNKKHEARPARR